MEYIWIDCCKNEEGKVVPEPYLFEAIQEFTPFPPLNGRQFEIMEAQLKHINFVLEVDEESIRDSAKYYSRAVLKWNKPGSASWNPLAHVCVSQEESDDDIVIGYCRKYAITKEMRQERAYAKLVEILSSPELIDSWIRENCSEGKIPGDWERRPYKD